MRIPHVLSGNSPKDNFPLFIHLVLCVITVGSLIPLGRNISAYSRNLINNFIAN
jgi:hypothetical protein